MLEILFIVFLCKSIGKQCRDKGHSPGGYQAMLVIFWIVGEVVGAFVGASMAEGETAMLYVMALVGAAVGATIVFVIVGSLSNKSRSAGAQSFGGIGNFGQSDAEAQAAMKMAQDCEAARNWPQAINFWQQVMQKAATPQLAEQARQRGLQLQQWLAQQQQPQQPPGR